MLNVRTGTTALVIAVIGASFLPSGQAWQDPAPRIAAQRAAMERFAAMDGTWRGAAWTLLPSGEKHELTQTERVGSLLGGSIKVIEGRGYEASGETAFNAFAVVSYDPDKKSYSMRSYAQGHAGDFAVKPTDDGFTWEIPAGPMTIRYTAVIEGDSWTEHGERIVPGKEPVRTFEMTLTRVGDTEWPAGGAVGTK